MSTDGAGPMEDATRRNKRMEQRNREVIRVESAAERVEVGLRKEKS